MFSQAVWGGRPVGWRQSGQLEVSRQIGAAWKARRTLSLSEKQNKTSKKKNTVKLVFKKHEWPRNPIMCILTCVFLVLADH